MTTDKATEPTSESPAPDELVIGDLRREHWVVPVHGLASGDPGGIVRAIAGPDGMVMLHLACGDFRAIVRLDVCRAAQLSTGIWEAAGVSQQLISYGYLGDQALSPLPLPTRPEARRATLGTHLSQSASPRSRFSASRRRPPTGTNHAAMDIDTTRTIGGRLRRIRKAQGKSLVVVAGLAGMGKSTLHRIEHGQRDLSISEIVALANALQIDPTTLIILPARTPTNNDDPDRPICGKEVDGDAGKRPLVRVMRTGDRLRAGCHDLQ